MPRQIPARPAPRPPLETIAARLDDLRRETAMLRSRLRAVDRRLARQLSRSTAPPPRSPHS